jgi:hypothetical protein
VWLFVPSGTIPWTRARSPAIDAAIEVIGETVVAMSGPWPFALESPDEAVPEHAASTSPAAAAMSAALSLMREP